MDNNNLKPKSIGGISFKDEPAKSSQQSYQSQSSQLQGGGKSSGGNNMILWVIIGILSVALLIAIIILIVRDKDSSKDKKEETTTEATTSEEGKTDGTTEAGTDATTEANTGDTTEATTATATTEATQTGAYEYIAPTAFSGDWTDFQISINDVYYQFPFPYPVLAANGWVVDNGPATVGSGDTELVFAASPHSGKDFIFSVTNPGATSQPLENCLVTGLMLENDITEDVVKLGDDLVFLTATKNDFKVAFGAPDWVQEYEDMEYVSYITDDYKGVLDMEMDANGVCYKISIENMTLPEGLAVDTEISTEVPEINSAYVAPTGPSADVADSIITIDGYNYQLPCPVSEFTKNGWKIETMTDEYINANSWTLSAFEKDGEKFFCEIKNYTGDTIYTANGMVSMIDAYDEYAKNVEIVFPGNIALTGNASEFEALYSGYENYACDKDDEYETLSYSVTVFLDPEGHKSIFIWLDCDYNTGEILEYQYEYCD